MTEKRITYESTGYFSKLVIDYLEENERLKSFYNHKPGIESFRSQIEQRRDVSVDREALSSVLFDQYEGMELKKEVNANIKGLLQDNTFTITTGHQLNLFTGPLYSIYKIASVINLTNSLKKEYPDFNFVPLFWMASEDHDFDEVNHFNLFGQHYKVEKSQKGAVGPMKLKGVDELIHNLQKELTNRTWSQEVIDVFSKFYSSKKTFAEATRGLIDYLFGKHGLVVIDGNSLELKRLMGDEFKKELTGQFSFHLVNQTTDKLLNLGYHAQVKPREINLFYLVNGLRERIVRTDHGYLINNTELQFSEKEMLVELEAYPERFSPNVVLRPLYQEKVLPNLAYIGGGAELSYWLQLKSIFEKSNVSFPILFLRNSALLIDGSTQRKLKKLGMEPEILFKDLDSMIKSYLSRKSNIDLELEMEKQTIQLAFNDIMKKANDVDQSLSPYVESELKRVMKSLESIKKRILKSQKSHNEISLRQIQNLKERLFPQGVLQERYENVIMLFIFYGISIVDELVDKLDPLDRRFQVLFK